MQLIFTDTDSFIYELKTKDVHADIKNHFRQYFDTSNFPKEHSLYTEQYKKVPGYFKVETKDKLIKDFVGVRSKVYSYYR